MKNKKGWIEIVEAFVSILLIMGVVLIIFNKGSFGGEDISIRVYNIEVSILREIQTNEEFREDIASAPNLPVEWEDSEFPESVKNKIIERTPDYLECIGKICEIDTACSWEGIEGKDIYAESIVISATLGEEVYRQVNLFCWII